MIVMAYLKSGALLKLLFDMKSDEKNASEDDKKPVLLQIRSIIPVLEEGDLWPNRGFYLKVSDMSHAMYVSLPEDQNEMILSNKLKLGQFIYVQKLEKSQPVPVLRGITPVPGRRQCEGTPEDIISTAKFMKLLEAPEADSIVEKAVISEKKFDASSSPRKLSRRTSDTHALGKRREGLEERTRGRFRSLSASKSRPGEQRIGLNCIPIKEISDVEERNFNVKSMSSSVDYDSDTDSTLSTLSSVSSIRASRRRIWNESEILGVQEIFDSSTVKHEIKPRRSRSRSATASPVRSVRYDSSDDNSSSAARRRSTGPAKKSVKSAKRLKSPKTKTAVEQTPCSICSLIGEKKGAETGVSWGSLPPSLVKLGKEVIRQRDNALLAAADALQEACAAERLLNSLSTFSEFHLAEGDDLQPYVDKFFDLQEDLAQTRFIMQSLTNISPLRTPETDSTSKSSVKEALTMALERNKNATMWIKSAVAVDLSPCSTTLSPITTTVAASQAAKKSGTGSSRIKPKGVSIVKTRRNSNDIPLILASADKGEQPEWTKRSTLGAATHLATSLQDECRKLFLSYVEKYLDEVERKSSSVDSDGQIAGMMYKVKKVNDWLEIVVNKGDSTINSHALEACIRVRNKIYEILLKHVERTAKALDSITT